MIRMKILKEKRFRIIIFLLLLLGVILILKLITPKKVVPEITETNPANKQENVSLDSQISISLNEPAVISEWQVIVDPRINFSLEEKNGSINIVPIEPLTQSTLYLVELKNINFFDFYYSFSFTTKQVSFPPPEISIAPGKGDPKFYQTIQKSIDKNYPLFKFIPYQGKGWSVDYLKPLTLEAILVRDTPQVRQEVLNWIISKNVDPATHKIEWKVK